MVIIWFFNFFVSLALIGSTYWFLSWFMLELSTFMFIPIIVYGKTGPSSKLIMWKYFINQCIGSILFFFGMTLNQYSMKFDFTQILVSLIVTCGMMLKTGLPPFHKWMFEVGESLSWIKFFLVNTLQKIGPIMIMWNSFGFKSPIIVMAMFWVMFSLFSLWDWSIRRFLMYSSIANMSWIFIGCLMDSMSCIIYMMIYFSSLGSICMMLSKSSFSSFSIIGNSTKVNSSFSLYQLLIPVNILSMAGMPPLAGFFPKYEILVSLVKLGYQPLAIFMLVCSMFLLVMYMYIMLVALIKSSKFHLNIWYSLNLPYWMTHLSILFFQIVFCLFYYYS